MPPKVSTSSESEVSAPSAPKFGPSVPSDDLLDSIPLIPSTSPPRSTSRTRDLKDADTAHKDALLIQAEVQQYNKKEPVENIISNSFSHVKSILKKDKSSKNPSTNITCR